MRSKHTSYGDLRKNLTKNSREQEKIIEGWWDGVIPHLFVHLELHEEFLFELGAESARRKQWIDYIVK